MSELFDLQELPRNFWTPVPDSIQFSITTLDEFGLPIERRGIRTRYPRPDEATEFAIEAGAVVKKTFDLILGGTP